MRPVKIRGKGENRKAKSTARGVISSSRRGGIGVFCQNTQYRPLSHSVLNCRLCYITLEQLSKEWEEIIEVVSVNDYIRSEGAA